MQNSWCDRFEIPLVSANGDIRRRNFLLRALALPFYGGLGVRGLRAGSEDRLHPRYRLDTPLDAFRARGAAGSSDFPSEKEHRPIAEVLGQWAAGLQESPRNVRPIAAAMAVDFQGGPATGTGWHVVRAGPGLEVRRVTFGTGAGLGAAGFVGELEGWLGGYSEIITADFQVTRLDVTDGSVRTRVRYELAGTVAGYYREQRAGTWEMAWTTAPGEMRRVRRWRWLEETRSRSSAPWFADVTAQCLGGNASYAQQLAHGADYWRTVLDGACGIDIYGHNGVSAGDIDGDGFDDLYVCQPAGLPNRLYRNRGDGTFEDITEASGTGILENTACALIADFDNDGRQDLVVVRANGPLLFLNEGGGKFRLERDAFQFAQAPQGTFTGACAADYNGDGLLDIYFCLYSYYQGADQYQYPVPYYAAENGPPNFLMKNRGDGTFRDATAETGLSRNNTRYSFCCGWGDFNGDGWPDLYVVNDFGRKNLYRNNGDGTFTDVAAEAGVEDTGAGMSVSWTDFDNDGASDLYVGNMWTAAGERISAQEEFQKNATAAVRASYRKHAMGNSLFRNGGARFADVTAAAQTGNGRWAWSSDAWDFDHDGFDDLYIANGMLSGPISEDLNSFFWREVVARSPNRAQASPDYEQGWNAINELIRADYSWSGFERNLVYANNRDGTFSDVSGAVGLDFREDGRAFALADFDHDGRQELCLKNRNAPQLRLMKNVVEQLPPSMLFRLVGAKGNRDAIGAVVTVETGAGRQSKSLQAGSGFLSQHSKEMFFGLGAAVGPVKATIRWPGGLMQELRDLPMNRRVWVEEGKAPVRIDEFRSAAKMGAGNARAGELLPATTETWLLAPVAAPALPVGAVQRKAALVQLLAMGAADTLRENWTGGTRLQLLSVRVDQNEDLAAIYNILSRYIFDRHRDLVLPASFLIDSDGQVVKIYQGAVAEAKIAEDFRGLPHTRAEQIARALPFVGSLETYEFGRNSLSLGSAFFERGYFEPAEAAFRQALRNAPGSAEAEYGVGSVYLTQGEAGKARESFERTVKMNAAYPDTLPNAWNNLGLLDTREGRMDEAVAHFQKALRISPEYWIALENLGNVYRLQRRWAEARATLEQALAARPLDAEANYNLAMVFAQTDDAARAHEYLLKALRIRPAYAEALNNLGILYLRTGRRDEAVAKFEECMREAPGFDQSYLNLARVYSMEGAKERAREVLRALLKQRPEDAKGRSALDRLLP